MLHDDRPLWRETGVLIRDGGRPRPLRLALRARTVELRLKGRRYRYEVTWQAVWERALEIEARRWLAERRKQREERRRQRRAETGS